MKYVVMLTFVIFLFSCSNRNNKIHSESEGKNGIIKNQDLIKPIEVFIKEPIDPARMIILNRSLFVSCFKCSPMIYTFSVPKLEMKDSFGIKGQGPDEFNFAVFGAGSESDLYIWGYSNLKQINQYKVMELLIYINIRIG